MAVKYLAGERLIGTAAERTALTTTDSLGSAGVSLNKGATLDTTNEKLGTGCLDFDGSNDYIDASNLQTNSAMTTKGTIAFWINFDAITNGEKVFMISDSDGTAGQIYMEIESSGTSGKIMCGCDLGGTAQWAIRMASGLLSASTWYHVALTHDGTSPKVYLNGVDQTTTQVSTDLTKWVSMTAGMDSFGFGRSNYNSSTGAYFNGKFDDIGIWNDALIVGTDEDTADSIKWLFDTGTGRLANTITSGLKAYYNCNAIGLGQTETEDFSSDANWTSSSGAEINVNSTVSSAVANGTGVDAGDYAVRELPWTLSNTSWKIQWDINTTQNSPNDNASIWCCVSDVIHGITGTSDTTNMSALGVYGDQTGYIGWGKLTTGTVRISSGTYVVSHNSDSTRRYFTLERVGNTLELKAWNSAYDTQSGSTKTDNHSDIASVDDLKYLMFQSYYANSVSRNTENLVITNGHLDIANNYSDTVVLNLPNGAIYEESDTGKIYMFDGTSAWNEIA